MNQNKKIPSIVLLGMLLNGCASITGTTGQSVSLQTKETSGSEVVGARCDLTNSKGTWFVTTPGSASIHRSNDDLIVLCKKDGMDSGRVSVVSATKGSMWGNIVFGGGVGAIIDHSNGSAYEYPTLIDVVMGQTGRIEPPKSEQPQTDNPMMGAPASKQPSEIVSQEKN